MLKSLAVALAVAGAVVAGAPASRAAPPLVAPKAEDADGVEFYEMLTAILLGSRIGPDGGWFHPAETRYTWEWLAEKHGISPKEAIPKDRFRGPAELFGRLDRNGDGVIRADDLDWSPPRPKGPPPEMKGPPPGMPDRRTLLKGLFGGEIGSPSTGPKVEQMAPDFTLRTPDGKRQIKLSSFRGNKPVVLIFGSFT
jgi:hypothetical protein